MKLWAVVLVLVVVLVLLSPSNADANPGNVQTPSSGPWLGQTGTASNGLAQFPTTIVGIRAAGQNALRIYNDGHTTYTDFGAVWSGGAANYGAAIAQANGAVAAATFELETPFDLADLLHGIFFAEASADPTNGLQRIIGATWAWVGQ